LEPVESKKHVSHSSLRALELGPRYFRRYQEIGGESSQATTLGDAIHCYILRPDDFPLEYGISSVAPVGGFMGVFIASLVRNIASGLDKHIATEIAYGESGFKLPLDRVIRDSEKPENVAYMNELLDNVGKIVIAAGDMDIVSACKESIMAHKTASNLILEDGQNELEINWDHGDVPVKSILDKLTYYPLERRLVITDLKTTSGNVYKFASSYKKYGYYRQMAIYQEAALNWASQAGIDVKSALTVEQYIVAVQTTGLNETVVYKIPSEDLAAGYGEFVNLLERYRWHRDTGHWDYPKEYHEGPGFLPISINDGDNTKEQGV
jgi:hypothetical protein